MTLKKGPKKLCKIIGSVVLKRIRLRSCMGDKIFKCKINNVMPSKGKNQ